MTEVPAIIKVWGIGSPMDQFFKSIYPNMSTEISALQWVFCVECKEQDMHGKLGIQFETNLILTHGKQTTH